jgi:hypothetical protein
MGMRRNQPAGHDDGMRFALPVLALAAALLSAVAFASAPRHVVLVHRAPASVAGAGFKTNARVTLAVEAGRLRLVKVVSSNSSGRFTAHWRSTLPACAVVVVTARSAAGVTSARFVPHSSAGCGGPQGPLGPPSTAP